MADSVTWGTPVDVSGSGEIDQAGEWVRLNLSTIPPWLAALLTPTGWTTKLGAVSTKLGGYSQTWDPIHQQQQDIGPIPQGFDKVLFDLLPDIAGTLAVGSITGTYTPGGSIVAISVKFASVSQSNLLPVPNLAWTTITADTADSGDAALTAEYLANSHWKSPGAGVAIVIFAVTWAAFGSDQDIALQVLKNGSPMRQVSALTNASAGHLTQQVTALIDVAANDLIVGQVFQASGGNVNCDGAGSGLGPQSQVIFITGI